MHTYCKQKKNIINTIIIVNICLPVRFSSYFFFIHSTFWWLSHSVRVFCCFYCFLVYQQMSAELMHCFLKCNSENKSIFLELFWRLLEGTKKRTEWGYWKGRIKNRTHRHTRLICFSYIIFSGDVVFQNRKLLNRLCNAKQENIGLVRWTNLLCLFDQPTIAILRRNITWCYNQH